MRNQASIAKAWLDRLLILAKAESGQTAVEMAVVLPTAFLLLFGSIQYSITLFTYCNVTYACRNAARYASVRSSSSLSPATVAQVQSVVTSSLFLNTSITPTVAVTYLTPTLATGTDTVGDFVEVSASWNQTILVPFLSHQSVSVGTRAYRMITR